jgi:adenylosuccinate lyase
MAAWDEGRSLKELLKSDPEVTQHLDPDEIEGCFDPARYLRHADEIFTRLEAL